MLPILPMQPHEPRPRQQLFRRYLLKPCLLVMPIWIALWVLDCIEVSLPPRPSAFFYFGICHVIMPAVLVWYLVQAQAAGEALGLEQSRSRREEAGCTVPVVSEDPSPTFLKELIAMNPVALICLVLLVMIRRTAVFEVIATSTRDPPAWPHAVRHAGRGAQGGGGHGEAHAGHFVNVHELSGMSPEPSRAS